METALTGHATAYGFGTTVRMPFAAALEKARFALAKEGFGVLTEIDVAATMKKKLGVDFPPYVILGACNPPLAHQALVAEREIGLLLPCNVIVYAAEDAEQTVVSIMDPEAALSLAGREEIRPLAREVSARLHRVLESVAQEH